LPHVAGLYPSFDAPARAQKQGEPLVFVGFGRQLQPAIGRSLAREGLLRTPITSEASFGAAAETILSRAHRLGAAATSQLLYSALLHSWLANLELSRLTADAKGTAMRYAQFDPAVEAPSKILKKHGCTYMLERTDLEPHLPGKLVTFWFRSSVQRPYLQNRPVIYSTIGELKQHFKLALDPYEMNALVVLG
jgi:hypothetical protein